MHEKRRKEKRRRIVYAWHLWQPSNKLKLSSLKTCALNYSLQKVWLIVKKKKKGRSLVAPISTLVSPLSNGRGWAFFHAVGERRIDSAVSRHLFPLQSHPTDKEKGRQPKSKWNPFQISSRITCTRTVVGKSEVHSMRRGLSPVKSIKRHKRRGGLSLKEEDWRDEPFFAFRLQQRKIPFCLNPPSSLFLAGQVLADEEDEEEG